MKKSSFFPHLVVTVLLLNSAPCFSDVNTSGPKAISAPRIDINAKQDFETAALRFKEFCDFCRNGEVQKVKSYLKQYVYSESNKIKPDINGTDKDGNSPLKIAKEAKHQEIVNLLEDAIEHQKSSQEERLKK